MPSYKYPQPSDSTMKVLGSVINPQLNELDVDRENYNKLFPDASMRAPVEWKLEDDLKNRLLKTAAEFETAPNEYATQLQFSTILQSAGYPLKDALRLSKSGAVQQELGLQYKENGTFEAMSNMFMSNWYSTRVGRNFGKYMQTGDERYLKLAEDYESKALQYKTAKTGYGWLGDLAVAGASTAGSSSTATVGGIAITGASTLIGLLVGGPAGAAAGYTLGQYAGKAWTMYEAGLEQAGADFYELYKMTDSNGNRLDLTTDEMKALFLVDSLLQGTVEVVGLDWAPGYKQMMNLIAPTVLRESITRTFGEILRKYGADVIKGIIGESLEEFTQEWVGAAIENAVLATSNSKDGTDFELNNWRDVAASASEAFGEAAKGMILQSVVSTSLGIGLDSARTAIASKNQTFSFDSDKKQGILNTKYIAGSETIKAEAQAEVDSESKKGTPSEGKKEENKGKLPQIKVVQTENGAVPATEEDANNLKELYKRNSGKDNFDVIIEGVTEDTLKTEDRASVLNTMGAFLNDFNDDGNVLGYADGSIVVKDEEAAESVKDKLSKNGLQRTAQGDAMVFMGDGTTTRLDIITKAQADADGLQYKPISTWQFQNMNFKNATRASSQEFLQQMEQQDALKRMIELTTGMTAEEVNNAFENDMNSISMNLPNGVTWENLSASAMFMPIMSQITGRSTDDLLSNNLIQFDVTGKTKYVDRATNKAMTLNEQSGKVELRDGQGNVVSEYDPNDAEHVARAGAEMGVADENGNRRFTIRVNKDARAEDIMHELMHVTRSLASKERLAGFIKAYGGEDLWTDDIKDNGDGTWSFNGQTYSTRPEAYNQARVNEERFVQDFMTYLREGSAPNSEIRSFFQSLKDFLKRFVNQFRDMLSEDTVRAFDKLLSGEVTVEPGQTIEEAVEASEATLTDDVSQWEANDYSDEEMFDEEGNPLYSLQKTSSARTSVANQIPSGYNKDLNYLQNWVKKSFGVDVYTEGQVNFEQGMGAYDAATKHLEEMGVENIGTDPFNRSKAFNEANAEKAMQKRVDTSSAMNVLNVIDDDEAMETVIAQSALPLKEGGVAIFQVYVGDKSGEGKYKNNGVQYQRNMKAEGYVPYVQKYYDDVESKSNFIIARNPKMDAVNKLTDGRFDFDTSSEALYSLSPDRDYRQVTFDDFHMSTRGTWEGIERNSEREKEIISKPYDFKSPSGSTYWYDRENNTIYRLSDHWGTVATCNWEIDSDEYSKGRWTLGKINLNDLSRKIRYDEKIGNVFFGPNWKVYKLDENGRITNLNSNSLYSLVDNKQWQTMDANTQRRIDADYDYTRNQYFGTDKWMKAPNGKPTNLTERQWIMVRTPAFKEWFGDWENDPENASKIVDDNGEPKVVFHGSMAQFETFLKTREIGYHFGTRLQAEEVQFMHYNNEAPWFGTAEAEEGEFPIYEVFLNSRNPITGIDDWGAFTGDNVAFYDHLYQKGYITDFQRKGLERMYELDDLYNRNGDPSRMNEYLRKALLQNGYDGIIYTNRMEGVRWEGRNQVYDDSYLVFNSNQIKSATNNNGAFSTTNDSILYSLTPDKEAGVNEYLSSLPEAEKERIVANLKQFKGTPWEKQAVAAALVRRDMMAVMAGGEPTAGGMLALEPKVIEALRKGIDGVFEYINSHSMIVKSEKALFAINGSLLDCNPSPECAKFCYVTKGRMAMPAAIVKAELVSLAIRSKPIEAAKLAAYQYKFNAGYDTKLTMRMFDRGDFSAEYVPFINELNRQGVAVQIFSKRPEFISQVDINRNVVMMSVDRSNIELIDQYPNLPLAVVYQGKQDVPLIESLKERFEKHKGVILPVKIGQKTLDVEEVKALPQWARTKYTCPIDSGTKTINNWNCRRCDVNGVNGCFYDRSVKNREQVGKSIENISIGELYDIIGGISESNRVAEELIRRGINVWDPRFGRVFELLSDIRRGKLEGADRGTTVGAGTEAQAHTGSQLGNETGTALSVEANNKVVEEFAKANDSTIVELDGVKYIEHSNGTYTQDELRSIKDSVSETLHSLRLQPELNFAGQLELDFNGDQNNDQTDKMGKRRDAGGDAGASKSDLRGLRPGVAQYFDWTRGWNGQEPSTAIDGQWDNLGYISFINTEIRSPEDLAKLYSVYRNPKLEYAHIIFTKGNTVAAHMALSTGVPDSAYAVPLGGMRYISSYMARIGADGYYLMHNHPSGDIGFSKADKGLTDNYKTHIPGFKGHIILDHNKFGFFDENMKFSERSVEGMHEASEEKLTSGFKESYGDMASSFGAIYMRSMHDPTFSIFYMDYRGKVVDIEDRTDIPTRNYLNERMRKNFHTYAVAFTNDKELYEQMREAAYNAKPQYNFIYVLLVDPTDPNYIEWFGESFYFNRNVWGYVKGTKRKSGEAIIPKFQHSDDTGTLYSLSPERKAEVLEQRKREIQRAVGAGIFVSTEYLNEFRGEDWVQAELDLRDWMIENPDVVALARNSDTVDEFKKKYLNKDKKNAEQDDIPFGENDLFDEDVPFTEPEEEQTESGDVSDTWFEKIFQYAHALSSADRDRQFAAEWTSTEDKTLELAKTLRSYMDAFFNAKPKSRRGGYWYTKTVWGAFKGVSQKVRMLQDGKGKRTSQRERSTSEEIKEAQELIRKNPRPYRNAYMTAMMAESRASQVRSGMQTGIGEDADWMALELIDDDIAQEMEKLEAESAENTRARKLGTDYKTKYEDLRKKMRDAQRDMEKATVDLKTSVGTLRSQLETANTRIAELNKTIKENEADMRSAESEYSKLIERLGGKIEDLEEQNAEYREKAKKAKQLQKQLEERRVRVAELRSELTEANRDVRRLTSALEAKRRYIEAKKAAEYRDARLRQIKRLAEFNSDTLDASYEETMNWILGLFVRDEGDMSVRKDIDSRIAALKARIEQARFSGENVEAEKQELIALRRQKMQSRMLEAPAQLALYLPEGYEVRADNRPSMWSAEELDTLLRALQLMRMDAKAMLADKQATRTAYLNAIAYKYFKQTSGYDASLDEYGEMSGREILSDIMAQPERTFGKGAEKILSYHLYKAKMQRLARLIDGNKEGVAYDWFVRKSYKCQTKELSEVNRRLALGDAVWKDLGLKHGELAKEGFQGEKQNGTKYSLTRGQMIGVYIYSQSDLGYEKLTSLSGNGIKEEDIDNISNALTDKERAWADFMLAEMDSNYQRLADVYYLVWNKNLGRRVAYFPLAGIGPMHSEDTDFLCGENAGKDSKSYVDKGFTKEVNPNALYPLNLDATATWNKQVRRQEHFVAYGEWARDTQRLLDEGRGILGAEIKQIYGEPYFRNVQRQVNHVISNYITTGTGFDTVFGKYFSARNVASLAASFSVMFKQLGSIGAIFETGSDFSTIFSGEEFFRNFLLANEELNAEFSGVENVRQFIYQNAPDIKNRKIDHEVMAYMNRVYGGAFSNAVQKVTGKVMEYTANLCDRLVVERLWLAKYYTEFENLKEQGWTVSKAHDEAVFKASQLISETQPTSMRMDQSGMQIEAQKNSLLRMITAFTNQAMNIENMVLFDIPMAIRQKEWKKVAQVAAAVAVNVGFVALVSGRFIKKGDEDDDKYRMRFIRELLATIVSVADPVFGGNLASGILYGANGQDYLSEFNDIGNAIRGMLTPSDRKTAWERISNAMEAVATEVINAAGIPAGNVFKRPVQAITEKNPGYLINTTWGQIVESYK